MKTRRFEEFLRRALTECGHPDIATVEPFANPGLDFPAGSKVTFRDGTSIYVRVIGSAPNGGDAHHSNTADDLTDEDRERLPEGRLHAASS